MNVHVVHWYVWAPYFSVDLLFLSRSSLASLSETLQYTANTPTACKQSVLAHVSNRKHQIQVYSLRMR